jgi:hypothetical protein
MKATQLNRGLHRRLMYIENKHGLLEGERAWIGWVGFSRTGRTLFYKGRSFIAIGGRGVSGNFMDEETRDEYWISGVKTRGSNSHPAEARVHVAVDDDARDEYERIKLG